MVIQQVKKNKWMKRSTWRYPNILPYVEKTMTAEDQELKHLAINCDVKIQG